MRLKLPAMSSHSSVNDSISRKAALAALAVLGAAILAAGVAAGIYPLVYAGALLGLFASAKLNP